MTSIPRNHYLLRCVHNHKKYTSHYFHKSYSSIHISHNCQKKQSMTQCIQCNLNHYTSNINHYHILNTLHLSSRTQHNIMYNYLRVRCTFYMSDDISSKRLTLSKRSFNKGCMHWNYMINSLYHKVQLLLNQIQHIHRHLAVKDPHMHHHHQILVLNYKHIHLQRRQHLQHIGNKPIIGMLHNEGIQILCSFHKSYQN